ncbi:protease 2 [Klebsiella pneumoniae]|jgi:oligopeptidase B|uniref:Protease 2 n=1 Tax=Klebsiella pneumoniae TaxID=573 RepID=A0A377TYD4_KLEPN|nr:protease 2 [Klebsiella pneumoniae]STW68866.1 protease 2 [Klebsiella pneumoniae]
MTLHGDTRIDNYYWLRDDERARPDVLEYLHAENAYGKQVMDSQLSLQERLLKEIIDRIPQREVSAPTVKTAFATVRCMSRAANTLSTSGSRC